MDVVTGYCIDLSLTKECHGVINISRIILTQQGNRVGTRIQIPGLVSIETGIHILHDICSGYRSISRRARIGIEIVYTIVIRYDRIYIASIDIYRASIR